MRFPAILISLIAILGGCCEDREEMCPCFSEDQLPFYKMCTYESSIPELYDCNGQEILSHVYKTLEYPPQAQEDSVQGRVAIGFYIYSDGSMGGYTTEFDTTATEYGLGAAATAAIMTLEKVGFCPARENCAPIDYYFVLPVIFRLP